MKGKSVLPILILVSVLLIPSVSARTRIQQVPDPYTYKVATISEPVTLDPHWAYDTVSCIKIMQVYETLIEFKGGSTDIFIPELADSWTISPDGLTYTFHIRSGVLFHDGSTLTPADVEYSFERGMVRDPVGGPMWMLYEVLIGIMSSRLYPGWQTPQGIEELGHKIDDAITRDDLAHTVTFHLIEPKGFFLQILAQTWSSILSKAYMTRLFPFPGTIDSFDWPGFEVTGYGEGWRIYNDYQREKQPGYYGVRCSPLDKPLAMMGNGPFRFVEWIPGEGGNLTLDRYRPYWGGWPAGALGTARAGQYPIPSRGWIERYVEYHVSSWAERKLGFLAGDYDSIYIPRAYAREVWQQPGIRCRYPGRSLSVDALFFNFNVSDGISGISPFVGNEQWGAGLPLNAFSDLNFRKGFAYTVNFTMLLEQQWLYEAFQVASPHLPGLVPWDISLIAWHVAHRLNIDLVKAVYYLKLSWGGVDIRSGIPGIPVFPEDPAFVIPGVAWTLGFTFDYVYNAGNIYRGWLGDLMSPILLTMNPTFHMNSIGVNWTTLLDYTHYEQANYRSIMPLWACGWSADYAHADNAFRAFMHTYGYFAHAQSYGYAAIDSLIEEGAYDELNRIFIIDLPTLMGFQPLVRRWERDWVQGWYYNPLFGGSAADQVGESVDSNLYTIWKEALPWEDIDANGKVEIKDLSIAAKAYGSYFVGMLPPNYVDGHATPAAPGYPNPPWGYYTATWDSRADVNQDMKVDIKDLAKMAKLFGHQHPPWVPPP